MKKEPKESILSRFNLKEDKTMSEEHVPADYTEMDLLEAKKFDKKVKEDFMPAIVSTVKQIIKDYGVLAGVCLDIGCGTAAHAPILRSQPRTSG